MNNAITQSLQKKMIKIFNKYSHETVLAVVIYRYTTTTTATTSTTSTNTTNATLKYKKKKTNTKLNKYNCIFINYLLHWVILMSAILYSISVSIKIIQCKLVVGIFPQIKRLLSH